MGFKFGSFLAGATTGILESVEKQAKINAESIAGRVKNAAEVYMDQEKQLQKTKQELKTTISSAAAIKWSDGTFDDQQLIALASNPDTAKAVIEAVKKDPSLTSRVSKNFVKALNTVPTNTTPQEYVDSLFKTTKATETDLNKMFGAVTEGNFIDRMASKKNLETAVRSASKYGVSLDDLFGKRSTTAQSTQRMVEVNFGALVKSPEFKDLKDKAQVDLYNAEQSGDPAKIKEAKDNIQRITLVEDTSKVVNKTEPQIQTELVNDIIKARQAGNDQQAKDLEAVLKQRQNLRAGESPEKVSQSNLITIASKNLTSVLQSALPPGSYITSVNADGTIRTDLKDLKQERPYLEAIQRSNEYIIKEFTNPDGKPKSDLHRNALTSRGVTFDDDGKAVAPVIPALNALRQKETSTTPNPAPTRPGEARQPAAAASQPAAATAQPPASLAPTMTPVERATASLAEAVRSRDAMANNKNVTSAQKAEALNILDKEIAKLKEDIATLSRTGGAAKPAQQQQPAADKVLKWNPQKQQWE